MDYDHLEKEVDKGKDRRQILRDEIKKTSDDQLKSRLRKILVKNIKKIGASKNV